MENQWFSAILGKEFWYNVPDVYQNGLHCNMSSSHLQFFIECLDKIHPSHEKIDFFELCLYVENQAIKQGRYDCGNLIRHLGWLMKKKEGRSKTEKELLKRIKENSGIVGYDWVANTMELLTWKEEYSRNAWLTPLYQCWYSLNKDNTKPETGIENRLIINQEVTDEFEKNADKYVLVDIDLSKARERKYWSCWWYDEGDREKVNEWLKENANDGDWLLWGEGSEGVCRFQVIESVGDGINKFSLELKGIPGKISSFYHSDRILKGSKNAGRDNVENYKWMDKLEGAKGTYAIGEVEQKNFFRTLKPIALDGVNFFLSSYNIDKGGNQWEKARFNSAVGFKTSKPSTKKIFDTTHAEYDKNYTPKPKDVLLFRRSGAKPGSEGGLSDIFTIKEVSSDSTKIDKIKNIKPTWDAVDVVVYCEDKRIDLYGQSGCVYEGPYKSDKEHPKEKMWSSTFHRSNGKKLNKNDLNGEIFKDGPREIGYRTFYDYFEHIINGRWWHNLNDSSEDNQFNILRYLVTVYGRMEKISLESESGTMVNGKSSSVNNDGLIKDIMSETYLEEKLVENIVSELFDKKQIVLQGPPGTGKTFVAKKIAECLKKYGFGGEGLIQFHASYSYEEFMEGYKPKDVDGNLIFRIKDGVFKDFCKRFQGGIFEFKRNNKGVFIIDEINRGRTSAIFGELMYLLEYREENITLPYSGRGFRIPDGVYIIGTMNTADRSIAMVDYALRRRFAFFDMEPNEKLFNKPGTEFWIKDDGVREDVVNVMKELNGKIEKINGLGDGYRIGHSYFMRKGGIDREQFIRILKYRVGALIREYGQIIDDVAKKSLNDIIEEFEQRYE